MLHNKHKILFSVFVLALLTSGSSYSSNFEIYKFLEVGATTTDNLGLANSTSFNEGELVFNLKPSVEIRYIGNRFGLVTLGEIEYYRFNDREDDIIDPRLFTRLNGTLIDNLLFLDSKLALTQLAVDNSFFRPTDDGDTTAVSDTRLYMVKDLGKTTDLTLGYTFSTIADIDNNDSEVTEHILDLNIENNSEDNDFLWGLGAVYSRDQSSNTEFENSYVFGNLGRAISNTVFATISYGIENRELVRSTNGSNPIAIENEDSKSWKTEIKWTPTELTSLAVGYEDRFFGAGPTMELMHRKRNSIITFNVSRDISRDATSLTGVSTLSNNTISSINDTSAVELDNPNTLSPLDEPFTNDRIQLSYKLKGRRSDFIVDAVYSDQKSLSGGSTIQSLLGRLVFDRYLSNLLTLRLQYDYQDSEANNTANLNFVENRYSIKFIYNFDGRKIFSTGDN